jgi:UDP-N-acetylmuramate dehydrogenase
MTRPTFPDSLTLTRGIARDIPLDGFCTLAVGGPARFLAQPVNVRELREVLFAALSSGIPWFVLGGGSNILVADSGFPGVVIKLAGEFNRLQFTGSGEVVAGAAVRLGRLVRRCLDAGMGDGIESLHGIPGTLGGAVRMNAGAQGRSISEYLDEVELLEIPTSGSHQQPELELIKLSADQVRTLSGYRKGPLVGCQLVTKANLKVKVDRYPEEAGFRLQEVARMRRSCQPTTGASAGSVFKNPQGDKAGRLIEEAGCKGWREGPAEVSGKHANFIINRGGASAAQLYRLAERVREAVAEHSGVVLELEWQLVGGFGAIQQHRQGGRI